jgi:hypothetical protein
LLCLSAVVASQMYSQDKGPRRTLQRRGAEATQSKRHLRGGAVVDDHRVLHTDDFAETVVDNQWLVLLGILLLMGSGSAWNYCLLLTCCRTCEGRAPSLWETLICLVCCRPRRERHNYRHGRDPYYDDDGGCCCGGRRRRTVYVEPIYPYGAPVRPRPEAYAGYAHPV